MSNTKTASIVLTLLGTMVFTVQSASATTEISTCEEFQNINNDVDASYVLTQDIDCTETIGWSEGFEPIANTGYFYGSLDGQGYTVDGIMVSGIDSYTGIFGSTDDGAIIRNIGFTNVEITGGSYTGGAVGLNYGSIENVFVSGWVTSLSGYPGGVVGNNSGGTILNSYSQASVEVVGGVYAAGISGINSGTITNSYATGVIIATSPQGVTASNSGTITNTFWDTTTSGTSSSSGGTGKTTAEMKTQATFTSWDFTSVWGIDTTAEANSGYPYLRVQGPQVTNVTSTTADGLYGAGATIAVDVTFSEAVTSTGNVTVTLETGTTDRTCTFTVEMAASGSCTYTVQTGDATDDLTVNSVTGTIVADTTSYPLWDTTPQTNLADNETLIIETTAPTVTLTSSEVAEDATTSDDSLAFTATFSESVSGFAASDITVDNGTVTDFATTNVEEYTFSVESTDSGDVTIDIAVGVAQDIAGNSNTAATQYNFVFQKIVLVESVEVDDDTVTITYDNGETVQYIPFPNEHIFQYVISEDGQKVLVMGPGKIKIYNSAGVMSIKKIGRSDLKKSEVKVKMKKLYNNYETVVVLTPGNMLVWRLTEDGELKKKATANYESTSTLPNISFKKKKKHIKLKFDNAEKLTWKLKSNGKLKTVE